MKLDLAKNQHIDKKLTSLFTWNLGFNLGLAFGNEKPAPLKTGAAKSPGRSFLLPLVFARPVVA